MFVIWSINGPSSGFIGFGGGSFSLLAEGAVGQQVSGLA
jgi:hypothetical protein